MTLKLDFLKKYLILDMWKSCFCLVLFGILWEQWTVILCGALLPSHRSLEPVDYGLKHIQTELNKHFHLFLGCWVFCLLSERTITKTEMAIREVKSLLCLYLNIWFRSLWEWLMGSVWDGSEMPAEKVALGHLKLYHMGSYDKRSESQ